MAGDSTLAPWARELAEAYESGAHSQFLLYGNVHDRLPRGGAGDATSTLVRFLTEVLLARFPVVFSYDPGAGLLIERGQDVVDDWPPLKGGGALPRGALEAVHLVGNYLRYLRNLTILSNQQPGQVAVVLRGADLVVPRTAYGEVPALASILRDWACEDVYTQLPFATFLIADALNDVHPLLTANPRLCKVQVPLPDAAAIARLLRAWHGREPQTLAPLAGNLDQAAGRLTGLTLTAVDGLLRRRTHTRKPLVEGDLLSAKRALVEQECEGLIEFLTPDRTLDDVHGNPALVAWLKQDLALWRAGDIQAMPMGYLLAGPVGTGKTYMVECLAGQAGVPVVKLKNFRDKWVGSSEGNLEKIFRLIRALGRCMVFIDEADQALGRRDAGGNDGGLSGRLYSMMAQEMSDTRNRGKVLWILASSRPDLIEVDLKRPGRIDVKIPLLPTTTPDESLGLVGALLKRRGLVLDEAEKAAVLPTLPLRLTPGAAEALAVRAYRLHKAEGRAPGAALAACLQNYQPPVAPAVMEAQMRLAIREASDLAFVPESLRHLAAAEDGA